MWPKDQIVAAIQEFNFWNYGMDGVSIALEEDPEAQEWVPALADAIIESMGEDPDGSQGEEKD